MAKRQQAEWDSPYPAVWVLWRDAVTENGWGDPTKIGPPQECQTLGWLVSETEQDLVVALSLGFGSKGKVEVNGTVTIPRGWTEKMRKINAR